MLDRFNRSFLAVVLAVSCCLAAYSQAFAAQSLAYADEPALAMLEELENSGVFDENGEADIYAVLDSYVPVATEADEHGQITAAHALPAAIPTGYYVLATLMTALGVSLTVPDVQQAFQDGLASAADVVAQLGNDFMEFKQNVNVDKFMAWCAASVAYNGIAYSDLMYEQFEDASVDILANLALCVVDGKIQLDKFVQAAGAAIDVTVHKIQCAFALVNYFIEVCLGMHGDWWHRTVTETGLGSDAAWTRTYSTGSPTTVKYDKKRWLSDFGYGTGTAGYYVEQTFTLTQNSKYFTADPIELFNEEYQETLYLMPLAYAFSGTSSTFNGDITYYDKPTTYYAISDTKSNLLNLCIDTCATGMRSAGSNLARAFVGFQIYNVYTAEAVECFAWQGTYDSLTPDIVWENWRGCIEDVAFTFNWLKATTANLWVRGSYLFNNFMFDASQQFMNILNFDAGSYGSISSASGYVPHPIGISSSDMMDLNDIPFSGNPDVLNRGYLPDVPISGQYGQAKSINPAEGASIVGSDMVIDGDWIMNRGTIPVIAPDVLTPDMTWGNVLDNTQSGVIPNTNVGADTGAISIPGTDVWVGTRNPAIPDSKVDVTEGTLTDVIEGTITEPSWETTLKPSPFPVPAPSIESKDLDDIADLVSGKFPFCIPNDLTQLVGCFVAEGSAPRFTMTILNASYDMDFTMFDYAAGVLRIVMNVLLAVGAVMLIVRLLPAINIGKK